MIYMNEEIYAKICKNPKLLELFQEEELVAIFRILDSDLSDAKKKESVEAILKGNSDENL